MSGDVINLTYYENSDVLQSAIVTGGSALRIAAEKGSAESVLHADNIEIGMAPDGTTLTSLNARDHVVFDLSAAKDQPAKKVTSNALVASGADGKGLTVASFTEGVEYEETGGTPPVKRTVTSRTLDTSLKGGLGQIQEATFIGSARLRDAGDSAMQAAGSTMRYNMDTGQMSLTGAPGEPVPRVVNEQIQIDATNIEMNVEGSKMKAFGESRRVQSIMFPAKPGAKDAAPHAGPDEAGSAGEGRQPRARLYGRRERLDRVHGQRSCSCRVRRARRRSRATRFRSTARPATSSPKGR